MANAVTPLRLEPTAIAVNMILMAFLVCNRLLVNPFALNRAWASASRVVLTCGKRTSHTSICLVTVEPCGCFVACGWCLANLTYVHLSQESPPAQESD